jgi:hypothetical protein
MKYEPTKIYKGQTIQSPRFVRPEILTHPNIPKPLHGLAPRVILGDKWWNEQRKIAYAKNNYCCWACGIHQANAKYHQWLEAHEMYKYDYKKGSAELVEIVALCHSCHNFIHDGRMEMMVQSGKLEKEKYEDIIEHGMLILVTNKISRKSPKTTEIQQDWKKWHLVIDGKKYYSKFASIEEWHDFYAREE